MILNTIHCMRDRAHLAGAEWVIAEKDGNPKRAAEARGRYFRELAAIDTLMGHGPSPFAGLG